MIWVKKSLADEIAELETDENIDQELADLKAKMSPAATEKKVVKKSTKAK
jgi:phage shock protein A